MSELSVDLNCDLGESFGPYQFGNDKQILDYVTSVNIACGFHAGDPSIMKNTVKLSLEKEVAIGAHPGLPDLAGFGRREMAISPEDAHDLVMYQLGALSGFVEAEGGVMHHVKPHGALYNMASVNKSLAEAIAEAVYNINPELILYGLAGSQLLQAAAKLGLRAASEVFADRTYQQDGTLTSRNLSNALIVNPKEAVEQVLSMIIAGEVRSLQGKTLPIKADTVCIHGDNPHAAEFARQLHKTLIEKRIKLQAL